MMLTYPNIHQKKLLGSSTENEIKDNSSGISTTSTPQESSRKLSHISAAADRDYLDAVERGDEKKQQEIVAESIGSRMVNPARN